MADYPPYSVGKQIPLQEGRVLYNYFGRCLGSAHIRSRHPQVTRPFTTRALQAADGTELTAEVCTDCGRITQLQQT